MFQKRSVSQDRVRREEGRALNLGLRTAVSPELSEVAGASLAVASLPCRTGSVRVSRSPAVFLPDRPLALFLPDVLTDLPSACRTASPLTALFDLTVCELPGHSGSDAVADISLQGFAQEYAALLDRHMPASRGITLIGEGFGGLIALELARLRSERVTRAILLDTPFVLTRRCVGVSLGERWRRAPSEHTRRLLREVFCIEAATGHAFGRTAMYDAVEDVDFPCAILAGSDQAGSNGPSMLTDDDFGALHAANGTLLMPGRLEGAGHGMLQDDATACMATLGRLLAAHC